jgi:hypothetical protein
MPSTEAIYEIRIRAVLDAQRADWFPGLSIRSLPEGDTILVGPVIDQAALHSLLSRIRDLGVPLISVQRIEPPPDP